MKFRLIIMNFLQFAIWGSYLTSMGAFLYDVGLGAEIGNYYAMQGVVSIFMPAIIGILADRYMQAQRMLSLCHLLAACFIGGAAYVGLTMDVTAHSGLLFTLYSLSVAFYMPTLALSNSVAYTALDKAGLDTIKAFPPIRVFGTIGFIAAMWLVNFCKRDGVSYQNTAMQFVCCALFGLLLSAYALTLPSCPKGRESAKQSLSEALGLKAFSLFSNKTMAMFFIFSFLLGVSLQVTNGYANTYIQSFAGNPEYQGLFFVENSNLLISLSQVSETLCILLIPFFLRKYGIKVVMFIAMLGWVLRFGFFGMGNPGFPGVLLFILSCIVYGVAFDFFNISGSLFVDKETTLDIRSSAQGLFMMMTNGLGATVGSLGAKQIFNHFVFNLPEGTAQSVIEQGWRNGWYVFSLYALVVAVLFVLIFKYKHNSK